MIPRREFFTLIGGAAGWPLAARAQQGDRVRRIGVLMAGDENAEKQYLSAFIRALAGLGWTDGRNVRMDVRWGSSDTNRIRALARELVGLAIHRRSWVGEPGISMGCHNQRPA